MFPLCGCTATATGEHQDWPCHRRVCVRFRALCLVCSTVAAAVAVATRCIDRYRSAMIMPASARADGDRGRRGARALLCQLHRLGCHLLCTTGHSDTGVLVL